MCLQPTHHAFATPNSNHATRSLLMFSSPQGLTHLSFKFDNYCLPSSEDQYLGSQALARMLSRMGALESLRLHCPFSNNEGGETLMERWGALQAGPLMHVLDKQRKLRVLELLGETAACSFIFNVVVLWHAA